jgi:hypothetical protein
MIKSINHNVPSPQRLKSEIKILSTGNLRSWFAARVACHASIPTEYTSKDITLTGLSVWTCAAHVWITYTLAYITRIRHCLRAEVFGPRLHPFNTLCQQVWSAGVLHKVTDVTHPLRESTVFMVCHPPTFTRAFTSGTYFERYQIDKEQLGYAKNMNK